MKTTLPHPNDSAAREEIPLNDGFFAYCPAAIAGFARWSMLGNKKHNGNEPLHHARGKSTNHRDKILRHLMDINDQLAAIERRAEVLTPPELQQLMDDCDALFWRAGLLSQELHERFAGAPLAPGARLPQRQELKTLGDGLPKSIFTQNLRDRPEALDARLQAANDARRASGLGPIVIPAAERSTHIEDVTGPNFGPLEQGDNTQ